MLFAWVFWAGAVTLAFYLLSFGDICAILDPWVLVKAGVFK